MLTFDSSPRPSARSLSRLALLVPLFTLACDATVAGNNDVLRFRYDADDNFLPVAFSTPIGAGLAANVEVFVDPDGNGGSPEQAATVIDASSSNAAAITVVATQSNVITLLAHDPGTASITVETVRGTDVFDVTVVAVAKVDISHPGVIASDNPPSKGIVGGTARFIVSLKTSSNQAAVGIGQLAAVSDPTTAMAVLEAEHIGFLPVRFIAPGTAALIGTGDEPLAIEIVADADVTALDLNVANVDRAIVGVNVAAVLRGLTLANEKVVGVASLAQVSSADEAICTIVPNDQLGEGAYLVVPKAAGTCRVSATLGARGDSTELTVYEK